MADVGTTLREARMRQRLDLTELESETKIRTKYLRALENEEWDTLPGPAYVKSFLRTYAEALGLDSKLVVEEYKLRHERLSDTDLSPIRPPGRDRPGDRRRESRRLPGGVLVALVLAAIVVALALLGRSGGDEETPGGRTAGQGTGAQGGATAQAGAGRRGRPVRLQLVPTGSVSVCLVDAAAGGRVLVADETLDAGSPTRTFRSRRFQLGLGNGLVRLRVDGRTRSVPASSDPIALEVTSSGRRTLPPSRRPSCRR